MALNSYARLTLNGTALDGDTSVPHVGGTDVSTGHIEVYEVRWGAAAPAANVGGRLGRAELSPVAITKRIDQTTPLLYQGLFAGALVDGDLKLFESDPDTGETRHRFTLAVARARIQSIDSHSADTLDPRAANHPAREVVTLMASSVTWRDEVRGVEYRQDLLPR